MPHTFSFSGPRHAGRRRRRARRYGRGGRVRPNVRIGEQAVEQYYSSDEESFDQAGGEFYANEPGSEGEWYSDAGEEFFEERPEFEAAAAPAPAPQVDPFVLSAMQRNGLAGGVIADATPQFVHSDCNECGGAGKEEKYDEVIECPEQVECYEEAPQCDDDDDGNDAEVVAHIHALRKKVNKLKKHLEKQQAACPPEPECYEEDVTYEAEKYEALQPIYVDDFDCWVQNGEAEEMKEGDKGYLTDYYKCKRDDGKKKHKCDALKKHIAKCVKACAPFQRSLVLPNGKESVHVQLSGKQVGQFYVVDTTVSPLHELHVTNNVVTNFTVASEKAVKGRIVKIGSNGVAAVRPIAFSKFALRAPDAERVKQLTLAVLSK